MFTSYLARFNCFKGYLYFKSLFMMDVRQLWIWIPYDKAANRHGHEMNHIMNNAHHANPHRVASIVDTHVYMFVRRIYYNHAH